MKPKKILNDPKDAVEEFVEGLLLQYPNKLVKIANHNVVMRSDYKEQAVKLFSGGGSGHEPSHAGWIGEGMLTGAILGGIFASPSVNSISAALAAAGQGADVLLIVKNYTGDRLNFGMAAERANEKGMNVKLAVVADDCAVPRTKGITGARGVAGTVLVHKVAGAAQAAGKSLDEILEYVNTVNSHMGSLGVALDSVTIPGADSVNTRVPGDKIEVGLGIHGEAGMKQVDMMTADDMAEEMVNTIQAHGRLVDDAVVPLFEAGDKLCVLVNNLGGTSNFELSIFARSCIKAIEKSGASVVRVYVGTFMTSFDMHGVSLTILNVKDDILELLDAPTAAPAWVAADVWKADAPRPSLKEIDVKVETDTRAAGKQPPVTIDLTSAKDRILAATQKLADAEPLLTEYDTIVGDGDCGITMKRGATEVSKRVLDGTVNLSHPVPMFSDLADAVSDSMGGTSGVLLELMLRKIGSTLSNCAEIDEASLRKAFGEGVAAVSLYGGARAGSRTMLDALVPAAEASSFGEAAVAARAGADETAKMTVATAGRSNYLSEDTLQGTPDPGAVAMAILLESLVAG